MIDYDEEWILSLIFRKDGSVAYRACCFAVPATLITICLLILDEIFPDAREKSEFANLSSSITWSAISGTLMVLIGIRTRNAYSRFWEGTGLLHQMRGEWFDTVSNCVTFTIKARKGPKAEEVMLFRHTLVRLMSLAHGNALEEISGDQFEVDTIDVHGLDKGTLGHLKDCQERCHFNKVEVILHLIQSLIVQSHFDGILEIPPPILSRVFQTISRGFVNLLNAKKITDTRFPFPFVQLVAILMLVFTVMTPLLLSSFIENWFVAVVATFIPVFAVSCLNSISAELENPFGDDDNDLPIIHFQEEMNNCLLMLLHPNADAIAGTSKKVELDFEVLLAKFSSESANTGSVKHLGSTDSVRCGSRESRFDLLMADLDDGSLERHVSPVAAPEVKSTPPVNEKTFAPPESNLLSSAPPDTSLLSTPQVPVLQNGENAGSRHECQRPNTEVIIDSGQRRESHEEKPESRQECHQANAAVEILDSGQGRGLSDVTAYIANLQSPHQQTFGRSSKGAPGGSTV